MFEFELPDVGEGVAEGELIAWHVKAGEQIDEDEVVAEVETDKAIVDLPAPVAGRVVELRAEPGDVIPVGSVLITIDPDDDGEDEAAGGEKSEGDGAGEGAVENDQTDGTETDSTSARGVAPPSVRRLARELGVDLGSVSGSEPGGRITAADVRAAADTGGGERPDATARETTESETRSTDDATGERATNRKPTSSEPADRERTLAVPATRRIAREAGVDIDDVPTETTRDGVAYVESADVRAYAADEERKRSATGRSTDKRPVRTEPYRGTRRTIGRQMERAVEAAPHVTHHDTAVVERLVETRARLRSRAEERGVSLTYLPFVAKATVAALQEWPALNSTLDEEREEIVYKEHYDVGIAVATDAGLLVPVVENVDQKSVLEVAAETQDVIERARDRSLDREEMQGGTFTITNFGAVGGEYATPIINYPETAILGLGRIERRPVVESAGATVDAAESADNAAESRADAPDDGSEGAEPEVVARHTLPLSLSIDHRVIDGAQAAGFVNTLKGYLEEPSLLLLE